MMKIDLIYPASTSGSENYSSEPPLGPIALYSSLPEEWRRHVRFLDSTVMTQTEIDEGVNERKADVVAISCTMFNYANAVRLAEVAKRNGSWVVLGGIHITYLRDAILAKMQQGERAIDFLVTGYGEPTFYPLLRALAMGGSVTDIPNLSYIENGHIVVNPSAYNRHGSDPLAESIDYRPIDFRRYSEKFQRYGNLSSVSVAASMFTQRGCAYAGSRKCTFCSIEQINPRRPPNLIEQDIITLITEHHADHIRISDGDFTVDIRHMKRVADAAEHAFAKTGRRPTFYCFARADEIDEARIEALKRLNVVSVFIGYESGSDEMLRSMHKYTTKEQNLRSTELLKQHGIDVICAGIVLGAEGETEATLQETLQFVRELKSIGNTHALVATPLIPLPGSPSFTRLLQVLAKDAPGKYQEVITADDFDIEELIEIWNRYMCNVPLSRLLRASDEIATLFRIGIRFLNFSHEGSVTLSNKK